MGYQDRPPAPSLVVVQVPRVHVRQVRNEIRQLILEDSFSEELKEVMFKLYSDLKETD